MIDETGVTVTLPKSAYDALVAQNQSLESETRRRVERMLQSLVSMLEIKGPTMRPNTCAETGRA